MSTSLASLEADVLTIVKRPDLLADITLHTKNAILKAHTADFWLKDLYENAFSITTPATQYTVDPITLNTRWRKTAYINTIDATTGDVMRKLDPIPMVSFVDAYGYKKDYVWYEAGINLQIRCSGQETAFGFGAYLYPDVTLLTQGSWIVDNFPFAVIYEAARTLFKAIGFDEQSASMEKLVAEAMAMVRMVGLTTVGE